MADFDFIKGMNLSREELESFEKFVDMVEKAEKNPVGFSKSDMVAFTPAAALGIAVAKFAYDAYMDYRHSWLTAPDQDFEFQVKELARGLHRVEIEANSDAPSFDTYAKLRKTLQDARKGLKK
jgi:hypothetical protein